MIYYNEISSVIDILTNHLEPYGEILPVDVDGETYYLCNVTNVIDALDPEKTVKRASGIVKTLVFSKEKIPSDMEIFKVPETQVSTIYFNEIEGENIKNLVEKHDLKGVWFDEMGVV